MPSNENKIVGPTRDVSLDGESGVREATKDLIDRSKRDQFMKEFEIDLSRGSDGPRISMKVNGLSAVEFLERLREVIPDIEQRSPLVAIALGGLKQTAILNEAAASGRIVAPIGRTDAEWSRYADSQLAHGFGGREISVADLFIVSGARHLFEAERAAEPRQRDIFTRADKWIAELIKG